MKRPPIFVRQHPDLPREVQVICDEELPAEVEAVVGKKINDLFIGTMMTMETIVHIQATIDSTLDDLIRMGLLYQDHMNEWKFDHSRLQRNEESGDVEDVDVTVPHALRKVLPEC